MNKKIFFLFIVASFLFLSPLTVKADSSFYTGNFVWRYSNNTALPLYTNGIYYQWHQATDVSAGMSDYIFYLSNVGLGSFDYVLVNTWVKTPSAVSYSGYDSTSGITSSFDTSNSYQLHLVYTRTNNVSYEAPCLLVGSNTGEGDYAMWQCPIGITASSLTGVKFVVNNIYSATTLNIGINKWLTFHYTDSSNSDIYNGITAQTNAINNQTSAINDIGNSINNSSTTNANSSASTWFNSFNVGSTGSITSIVSAPLRLINSITATCQPVNLWFNWNLFKPSVGDKNITIPCGTTLFWENPNLLTSTGNKMTNFRNFWNLLLGGPVIYGLLVALVNVINNALNPINDELVTLSFNDPVNKQARDMRAMEIHESAKISHDSGLSAKDYASYSRRHRK